MKTAREIIGGLDRAIGHWQRAARAAELALGQLRSLRELTETLDPNAVPPESVLRELHYMIDRASHLCDAMTAAENPSKN